MASICLRAGWSMGTIKDRYLHYEKAGDQYVGRTVAGVSALSLDFAVSPAYFEFDNYDDEKKFEKMMNDFTGGKVNTNLVHVLKFLYAALVYHRDYLRQIMHPKNALFACPIFTNIPHGFEKKVKVGYPWNSTPSMPALTGVPPHILIMAQLKNMQRNQLELKDNIVKGLKEELDQRDIGGGYHASVVMESINEHHKSIMKELNEIISKQNDNSVESETNQNNNKGFKSSKKTGHNLHFYRGKFHLLPDGWVMPNLKFQSFVSMWLLGDEANGVPPLKILQAKDVNHLGKRAYKSLNEMRDLARAVRKAGIITGYWKDEYIWDLQKVTLLVQSILKFFKYESNVKGYKRRFEHLSWKSVHNLYLKNKKVLVGEVFLTKQKNTEKRQSTMYDAPGVHVSI